MSDVNATPVATAEVSIPDDFAAYAQYRATGELPVAEETSEVAAEEPAAESASESETEGDQEQEPGQERDDKGRFSKRGIQKRFHELTSKIRDLETQLSSSRETSAASSEVNPEQAQQSRQGEPQPGDYADVNEYIADLTKFTIRSEQQAQQRQYVDRINQEQERVAFESWTKRENALRGKHEDYDEAIESVKIPATPAIGELRSFLAESEVGPELLYHLAKNPAEVERIAALPPRRAIAEIGKLEDKLSTPKPKAPAVTKAPPPPQTVSTKSSPGQKPLTQVEDFAEYEARRRKGERS